MFMLDTKQNSECNNTCSGKGKKKLGFPGHPIMPARFLNLSDFYSYRLRLIGKLTVFLQIQEFSLMRPTVDSSTTATRHTLLSSNQSETSLPRQQPFTY